MGHSGLCSHPRCLTLVPLGTRFCPEHERKASDFGPYIRDRGPPEKEPWRRVYTTPEWAFCKRIVRDRDSYQCVHVEDGARCKVKHRLQVHHRIQLSTLWYGVIEANPYLMPEDRWPLFLRLATNPDICEMLCPPHHKEADVLLEKTAKTYRAEQRYAPPRTPASKRHTRKRRGRR